MSAHPQGATRAWKTQGVTSARNDSTNADDVGPILGRWGGPGDAPELSAKVRDYLAREVGTARPWPPVEVDLATIEPSRISAAVLDELRAVVGEAHCSTDPAARWRAAGGASYRDYVRQRGGETRLVPDVVVSPESHDQVQDVVDACARRGIAIVPVGGGTSVVGGLALEQARVAISTDRMRAVLEIDAVSNLVTVGAGITGPALEAILAARGLTLGHYPQSWQRASIGGYAATRSAGQASTGYGRSDDMVEQVRMATPAGEWTVGHVPSSAAGPDLLGLAVGSEGALGILTEVTLRVRETPGARRYEAWVFPSFEAGLATFREMAHSRVPADVMRLSDESETATTLLMSAPGGLAGRALDAYLLRRGIRRESAALAILGWEGVNDAIINSRRGSAREIAKRHGGVSLGRRPGESWRRHRFDGPHLRDALMDAGYLVETVETATTWRNLPRLYASMETALRDALTGGTASSGAKPYVMTHVSHVYETGASLYTTVIAVADQSDPHGQWARAKTAVSDAIVSAGGTITHHHAVGRDHAPWLAEEIGELGVKVLRSVKATLDPQGICNPGVLGL